MINMKPDEIDDFVEITPAKALQLRDACVLSSIEWGRNKTRRLALTFRLALLPASFSQILKPGARLSVAHSDGRKVLRLTPREDGLFKLFFCPATNVGAPMIRLPAPATKFRFAKHQAAVDPYMADGSIFVPLPRFFWPELPSADEAKASERLIEKPSPPKTMASIADSARSQAAKSAFLPAKIEAKAVSAHKSAYKSASQIAADRRVVKDGPMKEERTPVVSPTSRLGRAAADITSAIMGDPALSRSALGERKTGK